MGEFESISEADARALMDIAFWAPAAICKEVCASPCLYFGMAIDSRLAMQAIRVFREINPSGSGGTILNMSSSSGYTTMATLAYYCASKFGTAVPCSYLTWLTVHSPGGIDTGHFSRAPLRMEH